VQSELVQQVPFWMQALLAVQARWPPGQLQEPPGPEQV